MKAKLIKTDSDSHHNGHYFLNDEEGFAIGSTDYEWCRRVAASKPQYKLSKQNCDEIFGVVDVEKLANDVGEKYNHSLYQFAKDRFIEGYNKAMELNEDKVFTLEDVKKVYIQGKHGGKTQAYVEFDDYIQSLQQPSEIEVEIMMKKVVDETKIISAIKGVKGSGDKITTYKTVPKLDSERCLILKKK
jgi:hypothetical protein